MRGMERVGILGAGESGVGAAHLALRQGAEVFLSDRGTISPDVAAELASLPIGWEEGGHTEAELLRCDLVIKSPGIPQTAPVVQSIRNAGIRIVSEIEYASWHTEARIVAITGSNGKTTTTSLIYHILHRAGVSVALGGNIGNSFARLVADRPADVYVLELSSFQLEDCYAFCPSVGLVLNVTPDHLDRYDYSMEAYAAAKFRIGQRFAKGHLLVCNGDDAAIAGYLSGHALGGERCYFSMENAEAEGYSDGTTLMVRGVDGNAWSMPVDELGLVGRHNVYNSLAAALAAGGLGVSPAVIREGLSSFRGIAHRMELVGERGGVRYVNDSKATNVDAVWYALESMHGGVVWIAGGTDKGNDYRALLPLVSAKVRALVCLGVDNAKLIRDFGGVVPRVVEVRSAQDAVRVASELAEPGDTVLLSPACASFDLFRNYEDRGDQFRVAVQSLG